MSDYRKTGMLGDEFYDEPEKDVEDLEEKPEGESEASGEDTEDLVVDTDEGDDTDDDEGDGDDEGDDEDDAEDTNSYDKRFKELGLDKQYIDINDLLSRTPESNRTITQALQDRAELVKMLALQRAPQTENVTVEEKLPEVSSEDFYENPVEALRKLGLFDKKPEVNVEQLVANAVNSEVEATRIDTRFQSFKESKQSEAHVKNGTDFKTLMPLMEKIFNETIDPSTGKPVMASLPLDSGSQVLYELALSRSGKGKRTVVTTNSSSNDKRDRANTSASRGKVARPKSVEQLRKLSEAELEKLIGFDE